jgi:intein/homing endonuclease
MEPSAENSPTAQLQHLIKVLGLQRKFSFFIAEFNHYAYRDALINEISSQLKNSKILEITGNKYADFSQFKEQLADLSRRFSIIHIVSDWEQLYKDTWPEFFKGLNYQRDWIAANVPVSIILWLTPEDAREFILTAPDMWAWRGGVFRFGLPERCPPTSRRKEQQLARIYGILNYLKSHPNIETKLKIRLLKELSELYYRLGIFAEAEKYTLRILDFYKAGEVPMETYRSYKMLESIYIALGSDEQAAGAAKNHADIFNKLSPHQKALLSASSNQPDESRETTQR